MIRDIASEAVSFWITRVYLKKRKGYFGILKGFLHTSQKCFLEAHDIDTNQCPRVISGAAYCLEKDRLNMKARSIDLAAASQNSHLYQ